MKRVVFIVLWTAIFAIMTLSVWMIAWRWLMSSGIARVWTQDLVDRIQALAYLTYIAMPLLGLMLALFGKLPGTRLVKTHTFTHHLSTKSR